jgi:CRISPR/Cas system CMR subunit Cmr6 (Cas7 group RAMP superfamily)
MHLRKQPVPYLAVSTGTNFHFAIVLSVKFEAIIPTADRKMNLI